MISKVLPANSVYHTCRYVCNRKEAEIILSEGVRIHNYKLIAKDFEMQQQMRPGKKAACFHGILSFHPDEKPSNLLMQEIAKKYLEKMGLVETQYVIVKHEDKAHLHLHLIANMVNNKGKSISDSYIGLRGKKIAQGLTQEYGLIPAVKKNLEQTHLENLNETEATRYKIYMAIAENLPCCRTMEELESRLKKQGIEIQYKFKGKTEEKQGISFKIGNFCFKGSQVDRKYSFAGLQKSVKLNQDQELVQEDLQGIERKIVQSKQISIKGKADSKTGLTKENLSRSLIKELEKAGEAVVKPEQLNEELPFELLPKHKRKKNQKIQR